MKRFPATTLILVLLASGSLCGAGLDPTHRDVRYSDKYDRCVLDFWKVDSEKPAPLVVYFHGGAFKMGDKSHFYGHEMLKRYYLKGVAFATANYPFTDKLNPMAIMKQCEQVIVFLRSKAKEWNIDPQRIAVMGVSAGTMISEYLACGNRLMLTGCFAEQQPYGSEGLVSKMKRDNPPLILYTTSGPDDQVHNPKYAKMIRAQCDKVGARCEMYGTEVSGLPLLAKDKTISQRVMEVFCQEWKIPFFGEAAADAGKTTARK